MRIVGLLLLGFAVVPVTAMAARINVVCPAKTSADPPAAVEGWVSVTAFGAAPRPWSSSPAAISGIDIFEGHPRDGASLVPDDDHSVSGRVREATWALKGEHWVGCLYRGESNLLAWRLPPSTRYCWLQYETSKAGIQVRRLQCEVGDG